MERYKDIKKYYNIHKNRSGVLIGSGPSLLKKSTKKRLKEFEKNDYLFFGNNDTIFEKKLFRLDYFFLSDPTNLRRRGIKKFIKATAKKKKFPL